MAVTSTAMTVGRQAFHRRLRKQVRPLALRMAHYRVICELDDKATTGAVPAIGRRAAIFDS
jgi:hypothetical protein